MRYRLMATYQGVPYEAGIGPSEDDVVLFAACPPPEELGFEPATGHWRKQLRMADIQALWESRPTGMFRGGRCIILDDLGDRLHIAYLGHDAYQAERLGYWQVDRGVFELVAPRDEVIDVLEERADYPYPDASAGLGGFTGPDQTAPQQPGTGAGTNRYPAPVGPAAPYRTAPHPIIPPSMLPSPDLPPSGLPGSGPLSSPSHLSLPQPGLAQPGYSQPAPADLAGTGPAQHHEPPLPLEAAALRATSAAARHRAGAAVPASPDLAGPAPAGPAPGRRAGRPRLTTQRNFTDLASLAGIPATAYAVGAEMDGAMCLLPTAGGFEVFHAADGARHEMRLFADEESAYFYLFGVLAAEAVRTGGLVPGG